MKLGLNLTYDPTVPMEDILHVFQTWCIIHQAFSLWKKQETAQGLDKFKEASNILGAVPSKLELSGFWPLGPIFFSVWAFKKDQNIELEFPVLFVIRSSYAWRFH